jgi:hypothetical protein
MPTPATRRKIDSLLLALFWKFATAQTPGNRFGHALFCMPPKIYILANKFSPTTKSFIPIPRPHFAIQKRIAAPIFKRHSQGSQGRSRPMAHFSEGGKVAGRSFIMHLAIKCVHVCLRSDLVATRRVAQARRYITKHYCSRWRSAIRGLGRFRAIPDVYCTQPTPRGDDQAVMPTPQGRRRPPSHQGGGA